MPNKSTKGRVYPNPKVMKPHAILDMSTAKDWLKCNCGWEGKPADHAEHRKGAERQVA